MGFNSGFKGLIIVPSTCFEHSSVHPQEEMQFYCISFVYPYKQSGRCQDVFHSVCVCSNRDTALFKLW